MRVAVQSTPAESSSVADKPAVVDSIEVRARLRAVIARHGAVGAARRLGMPKDSLLATAADAPVRAGTILFAADCLAKLDAREGRT